MHHSHLHPDRIEQHTKETFQSHAEGGREIGQIPTVENFVVRSDGSEIQVEILASTITIDGKRIMQGVFRDITRRKKLENNLRIQRNISVILGQTNDLNLALKHLLEMVCQLDGIDSGGIFLVSPSTGNIDDIAHCGLSEQFVGQYSHLEANTIGASIIIGGETIYRSYQDILSRNIPPFIHENLHSFSIMPIMHNGKAIACFSVASHECDEIPKDTKITLESIASNLGATILRILTENQLKESEFKYAQSFQTSPDSVNINTMDGTYVDINDGFTTLMGYSKDEIIGCSSMDKNIWVIPEDRLKLIAGLQKEGRVENLESVFRAKDGTLRTALMSASLITINRVPHILSITRDISDRKKFETDLIAAKDKAEESDRLKSAFLSNLSHELRTPMNGILGFSDLLYDDSLSKEERHQYISVINNSGLSLLEVITNIMDISKIDSRQIEKRIRPFNLNLYLDELMKGFMNEKVIAEKPQLKVGLKKALPDEQSNIATDQGKIKHIFSLLLNNAAKFTNEGHIQFGYIMHKQKIRFFVKDTGKGIHPDKHDTIFERFRQEDDTLSRKYGGVGLGLAIAKGLVELLDGTIWVESEPGKGSAFWFEIPIV
jgi:PAS domain S-box-containing protein